MTYRRIVPFILIAFTLAGCFRQAEDSFDTVDSQGSLNSVGITQVAETATNTPEIMIIDPNSTPAEAATEDVNAAATEADSQQPDASATVRIIQPTATSMPTNIPLPATQSQQDTLPTATEQTIITPDTGPVQQAIPTATATSASQINNGLPPTPTALPGAEDGACEYIVSSGDNLFRIALNNDVTLADLLAANNLSEQSIIQPGQVLVIPGCVDDETAAESTASPEAEVTQTTIDGQVIHIVTSGETLLTIARLYDVTVNDIVQANSLANPNQLAVGQELIIPQTTEGE